MPGTARLAGGGGIWSVPEVFCRSRQDARGGVLADSARWRLDPRSAKGALTLESFYMGQRNARRRHFHFAVKHQTSGMRR